MPTATDLNTVRTSSSMSSLSEADFDGIFIATGSTENNGVSNGTYNSTEGTTSSSSNPLHIVTGTSLDVESSLSSLIQPLSSPSSPSASFVTTAIPAPHSNTVSINSSTLSSPSSNGVANMAVQKQHQLAYIQKEQNIQQQKQRMIIYHNQGLRQQQQQQQQLQQQQQQQRHQEKKRQQKERHFLPREEQQSESCSNGLRLYQIQHSLQSNELTDKCKQEENHQCDTDQTTAQSIISDIITPTEACSNSHTSTYSDTATSTKTNQIDLVDDVWRLIFYVLAGDCKDLGRSMVVNRRFYNLIANDAVLWKLSYHLTVSGSIFGSQKPLLSPTWIRKEHNLLSNNSGEGATVDQTQSLLSPKSNATQFSYVDMNEDSLSIETLSNNLEPRHPTRRNGGEYFSAQDSAGTGMTATISRRSSLVINQGLQIPSPLILPHHRRIIQSISSSNLAINQLNYQSTQEENTVGATNLQPIVDRSIDFQTLSQGTAMSASTSSNSLNSFGSSPLTSSRPTFGRTPASTPSSMCVSSFQLTIPPMTSQVVSNSTTPFSVIHNHIPTTTLMHRHPAVYWKNQVVEWLEREKLRCLRLGLFWGFNAEASRMHGRRSNNSYGAVSC